jgi:hypothetical protein
MECCSHFEALEAAFRLAASQLRRDQQPLAVLPTIASLHASTVAAEQQIADDVALLRNATSRILALFDIPEETTANGERSIRDPFGGAAATALLSGYSSWPLQACDSEMRGLLDQLVARQMIADGMPLEIAHEVCPVLDSSRRTDGDESEGACRSMCGELLSRCLAELNMSFEKATTPGTSQSSSSEAENEIFPLILSTLSQRLAESRSNGLDALQEDHPPSTALTVDEQRLVLAVEDITAASFVFRIGNLLKTQLQASSSPSPARRASADGSLRSTAREWFLLGKEISAAAGSTIVQCARRLRSMLEKAGKQGRNRLTSLPDGRPEALAWNSLLVAVGLAQRIAAARKSLARETDKDSEHALYMAATWCPALLSCPGFTDLLRFSVPYQQSEAINKREDEASWSDPFAMGLTWQHRLLQYLREVVVFAVAQEKSPELLQDGIYQASTAVMTALQDLSSRQLMSEHVAAAQRRRAKLFSCIGEEDVSAELPPIPLEELPPGLLPSAPSVYCPVTKARTVDPLVVPDPQNVLYNPPVALVCGHVISHRAARMISLSAGRRRATAQQLATGNVHPTSVVRCPYCSSDTAFGDLLVLRLLPPGK